MEQAITETTSMSCDQSESRGKVASDQPESGHVANNQPESRLDEAALTIAGLLMTATVMVLPLILVYLYNSNSSVNEAVMVGTAGVGVAAIFRGLSRDLLRTSIGVASRTAARAVSRHWTHVFIQWLANIFNRSHKVGPATATPHPIIAIIVGTVALSFSYATVLWLMPEAQRNSILGPVPLIVAGMMAAAPLMCYYAATFSAGRALGVEVAPRTELDGILLQLYFTFAVSYLPLTSDGEYHSGSAKRRAMVAVAAIGALVVAHLLLSTIGNALGVPFLTHLSVLFLLQAFVLAFPFEPLDGKQIWRVSKLLWVGVWVPIAICFHYRVPEVFHELI